jgi:hypothetical protein
MGILLYLILLALPTSHRTLQISKCICDPYIDHFSGYFEGRRLGSLVKPGMTYVQVRKLLGTPSFPVLSMRYTFEHYPALGVTVVYLDERVMEVTFTQWWVSSR